MSHSRPRLINTALIDAVPAQLVQPRRNTDARLLARADWLLRRKEDGRFLGAIELRDDVARFRPLDAAAARQPEALREMLRRLGWVPLQFASARRSVPLRRTPERSTRLQAPKPAVTKDYASKATGSSSRRKPGSSRMRGKIKMDPGFRRDDGSLYQRGFVSVGLSKTLQDRLALLGISAEDYQARSGLVACEEPEELVCVGRDRYRRPVWMLAPAARAWLRLQAAARADGVRLESISAFRSQAYQHGIFRRKLARGQRIEDILKVNAAPGFSEHHGGCALDIGSPGEPPAEETFEGSAAFAWLTRRAGAFGFVLSYPRGNPHGIVYEPWHWCWRAGP